MQEQQIALIQTAIKGLATTQMALQALIMPGEKPPEVAPGEGTVTPDPHFSHAEAQIHAQGRDLPKLTDKPKPTATEAVSNDSLVQGFLRKRGGDFVGSTVETIASEFADYISKPVLDGRNE